MSKDQTMERFTQLIKICASIASVALLVIHFLIYFAKTAYPLELLTHFRIQYTWSAFLCLLLLLLCKQWRLIALPAIALLIHGYYLYPYLPTSPQENHGDLKVILANVLLHNQQNQPLLDLVAKEKPDLLAVLEVHQSWLDRISTLKDTLPYVLEAPRNGFFGIAVYARYPIQEPQIYEGPDQVPSLRGSITTAQNKTITFIATHPMAPISKDKAALRNEQMAWIANQVASIQGHCFLVGDLNITPWNPVYKEFEANIRMKNARIGHGLLPSWPNWLPSFARIPIDHVFVRPSVNVQQIKRGPDIGSDHFPIITTLSFQSTHPQGY